MKLIVSAKPLTQVKINNGDYSKLNVIIQDVIFELQNFYLKDLSKSICENEDKVEILVYYNEDFILNYTILTPNCDKCKEIIREKMNNYKYK